MAKLMSNHDSQNVCEPDARRQGHVGDRIEQQIRDFAAIEEGDRCEAERVVRHTEPVRSLPRDDIDDDLFSIALRIDQRRRALAQWLQPEGLHSDVGIQICYVFLRRRDGRSRGSRIIVNAYRDGERVFGLRSGNAWYCGRAYDKQKN